MIVPGNRLLLWIALLVFPLAILAPLAPAASVPAAAVLAAFIALCAWDAWAAAGKLDGYEIQFPDVSRLTKDAEGIVSLTLLNRHGKPRRIRIGLPFPAEIASKDESLLVEAPEAGRFVTLEWPVRPSKRGLYALHEAYLETASPLGFWDLRRKAATSAEIRVYPNLLSERRGLASLFLNRGGAGIHAVRQIGKGHEFEKLREYVPGDSFEDIHWKATARCARPITKVFQVERTQEVYVVLDASRLSAREVEDPLYSFGAARQTPESSQDSEGDAERTPVVMTPLLDRCIRAALILGMVAEKQGDKYGLLTFSDRVQSFVRAGAGKAHYGVCRDSLYTIEPRRVAPDYDELFRFIRLRMNRRALLIFLTNLDDPSLAESFQRNLDLICRRHIVLVNMVAPPDAKPLFTGGDVPTTDAVYRRLAGHLLWADLKKLGSSLHQKGVRFTLLTHESMTPELVMQYLNVKQRQLL